MIELPDYEGEVAPTQGADLAELTRLADRQDRLEAEEIELDAALTAKRRELAHVREELIPGVMSRLGLAKFETATGLQVRVDRKLFATIPKDNPEPCLDWLEESGNGSIIKRDVMIRFGRGEQSEALETAARLERELGRAVTFAQKVEPQTLIKTLRESHEAGVEIPPVFGLHWRTQSKITRKG